jgi:hypothetical protein
MASTLVKDLIDKIQRITNRVDTDWRVRVREAIDDSIKNFAVHAPWDALERRETFIADGQAFMILPSRVARVMHVDDLTNKIALEPGQDWARRYDSTYLESSGEAPIEWRPAGVTPLVQTLATDTRLSIQSTVSENYGVVVRGLVRDTAASGSPLEFYAVEENFAMGGSDATQTANLFVRVDTIQKEVDTSGQLIVRNADDSSILSRIQPWEAQSEYPRIEFYQKPNAGHKLRVRYYVQPGVIDDESAAVPQGVPTEYIKWRAAGDIHWEKQESQPAQLAWAKADEILDSYRHRETAHGERDTQSRPTLSYYDMEE